MSRALKKDSWLSVFWIVCALLICVGSYRLSLGSPSDPGPGMFPFLAGAALGVLSIIEWWNISRAHRKDPRTLAQAVEPLFANRLGALKAAAIIAALLIYSLTMEHLGFILSTTLFIAFLLLLVERQRWYVIVFGSVVSSLTTYLVFKVWLDTALPVGLFGF
jgi:putative tricarboxylic transport membrane protein